MRPSYKIRGHKKRRLYIKRKPYKNYSDSFSEGDDSGTELLSGHGSGNDSEDYELTAEMKLVNYQLQRLLGKVKPDNTFIVYCLASFHLLGPKGYAQLCKMFDLIPQKKLIHIFSDIDFTAGINDKLIELVNLKFKLAYEIDKMCTLSIDEKFLERDLFERNDKTIVGYEDDGITRTQIPARFVTVFALRGIFATWTIPIAYYFTSKPFTAEKLKEVLISILNKLERTSGVQVKAVVGKMKRYVYDMSEKLLISPLNQKFIIEKSSLFFMFDIPQLMTVTRNNLMKHSIYFKNYRSSWKHVENFYLEIEKQSVFSTLSLDISRMHIYPDKHEITNPSVAVSLFNHEIVDKMQEYVDNKILPKEAEGTVKIFDFFAKLYSVFNSSYVKSYNEYSEAYVGSRKQTTFLKEALKFLDEIIVMKDSENLTHTVKFINGWKISISCLMNLWQEIEEPNIREMEFKPRCLFTSRINANPLGNFLLNFHNFSLTSRNEKPIHFLIRYKQFFMQNYFHFYSKKKFNYLEYQKRIVPMIPEIPKTGLDKDKENNCSESFTEYLSSQVH